MESIKQLRRWICWNAKKKDGRTTKVPCAAGGGATGTNETYVHTWVTYDEAVTAMQQHRYTGVGFVIPEDVFFVDKDHVELNAPEVKRLLEMFPSYAEISFSGDGVHIYGRCDLSRLPVKDGKLDKRYYTKNPNNGLEVYIGALTNRYAAFTGKVIQDLPMVDCTDALLTLLEEQMLRQTQVLSESATTDFQPMVTQGAIDEDDPRVEEIVAALRWDRNAPKFVRLYDNSDITGYTSQSEADAALCAIIAFRAGPNPALIDAIFRQSALYRDDKWERDDYRTKTIECGIAARRGVYHHSLQEKPPFVMMNPQTGAESVSPTRLAQYVREHLQYVFVQDHAMSSARCYVYQDGAYRLMSKVMVQGVIKQFIIDYNEHLVKTRTLNEVYDLLLTDNLFVSEEELNADEDIIHAKEETDDWEFVQVYTDEGISATNTKRRDGFNAMVRDALDGKIDLIITKSVSRFARNTVDSLTTVRKLKERGVEVYFEKENIYTLDSKGELLITIMSSLAQEESRSISENVTWGMRKRFADGKVSMPYKRFMGYRKGADGLPEIVEEETEVVRAIYKRFLEGDTICMIAKKLNQQGIPSPAEKKKLSGDGDEKVRKTAWCAGTVESILTNEKYKGDALLQKTYCTDFLTKKMKVNEGEVPQYYVQDSHPAIVDAAVFDLVQMELARCKALKGQYSGNGCFASRIVCGDCGHFYGSKVWHSNDQYRKVVWRCNHKYNGQKKCTSSHVTQETLECAFEEVMRRMIAQREHVIAACRLAVKEVLDTDDLKIEREGLEEKLLLLNERIRRLVNDNAQMELDQNEYQREYDELSAQYSEVMNRIKGNDEEARGRDVRKKQIELFLRMFERQEVDVEFDAGTFVAMVEKVVVKRMNNGKGMELRFVLRNGQKHKLEIR